MFLAKLFILAEKWKQPKCSFADKQINKVWYIHVIEYYMAIKTNKILIPATWMNFENIVSNERSQSQKATLYDSIYMQCPNQVNMQRVGYKQWLPRASGKEEMDTGFPFGVMKYSGIRWQ